MPLICLMIKLASWQLTSRILSISSFIWKSVQSAQFHQHCLSKIRYAHTGAAIEVHLKSSDNRFEGDSAISRLTSHIMRLHRPEYYDQPEMRKHHPDYHDLKLCSEFRSLSGNRQSCIYPRNCRPQNPAFHSCFAGHLACHIQRQSGCNPIQKFSAYYP